MSIYDQRRQQLFPVLNPVQIETARRFASGPECKFGAGEMVFDVGQRHVPVWLVLDGSLQIVRRDGLKQESVITTHEPGEFSGEVSQLADQEVLVAGYAGPQGLTAVPFDGPHLRALMIGSADVGELIMRAFILRRLGLLQEGGVGSVLLGNPASADLVKLEGFLERNGYPYRTLDASNAEGRELVERFGVKADELPLLICPDGTTLKRPSEAQAAACLGLIPEIDDKTVFDLAIVGAGPAGLAAAVYGGSEGLSVLVLDQRAFGGQAGASARIENYLGFPTGISGMGLAGRAFNQALKFGVLVAIPIEVARLDCGAADANGKPCFRLEFTDGKAVRARSVVIASGVRYRRLPIENLAEFEGTGVSYWATAVEAKLCAGEEVALIGGGNSAGQAAVFLAPKVKRLHLVIRASGLEQSMSRYLIDRIAALPNVELHTGTEIVSLEGDKLQGLTGALFRDRSTGETHSCPVRHLFVFIGADPNVGWLDGCIDRDDKGFVVTGSEVNSPALPLQTSHPGVFAIGDVRAGSTKRVAAAVGEGAQVIAQIHKMLAAE